MTGRPDGPALGLIVNPRAGIGGEVGLGGSDGAAVQAEAERRGGRARAPERAARFVRELERLAPGTRILTGPGPLGGEAAPGAELVAVDAGVGPDGATTAEATASLAAELSARGVAILVFVGGDGTARDVLRGAAPEQLCLGVPAGVKMHSGVFAVTPEDAAAQAAEALAGRGRTARRDVVDLDEDARRSGVLATSIFGSMRVPDHARLQRGKRSPAHGGGIDAAGVAEEIRSRFPDAALVFGPGTTVARVAERFGIEPTLLGFDALEPDGSTRTGLTGAELEELAARERIAVVLSPIGGQGFVIGRGNHQLTARVLERLAPDRLVLVAETAKLGELAGRLRIDAPTEALNDRFRGPARILLGPGETAIGRIE